MIRGLGAKLLSVSQILAVPMELEVGMQEETRLIHLLRGLKWFLRQQLPWLAARLTGGG